MRRTLIVLGLILYLASLFLPYGAKISARTFRYVHVSGWAFVARHWLIYVVLVILFGLLFFLKKLEAQLVLKTLVAASFTYILIMPFQGFLQQPLSEYLPDFKLLFTTILGTGWWITTILSIALCVLLFHKDFQRK